jgi:hypothetical protein
MTAIATEDQIERIVERQMDKLDLQYTKGMLTNDEYNQEVLELDRWARDQHRLSRARQYREW